MKHILEILPDYYADQVRRCGFTGLEELRLGSGRPLQLNYGGIMREVWPKLPQHAVEQILLSACQHSVYAYEDTIRQGYLTLQGGHRIGICGFGVKSGKEIRTLRNISSMMIRVAREVPGCADPCFHVLHSSALLIGPPGSGKTTLLRDLVRQLSNSGSPVGLADERGEVSAMNDGVPALDIGSHTDVLLNIPKASAVMMLLKTMAPKWIAVDEITAAEDLEAMMESAYCGVHLLATAHADSFEDLQRRPLYRRLLKLEIFEQYFLLHPDKTVTVLEGNQ